MSGLDPVIHRYEFYRDGYRKLVLIVAGLVVTVAMLIAMLFYSITREVEPLYFATTNDGKLIAMTPLAQPNITDPAILQWSIRAVTAVNTYDFAKWRDQLSGARVYFTPGGWDKYSATLKQSGTLDAVVSRRYLATAVVSGAPVILNKGVLNGVYAWQIQVPFTLIFEGTGSSRSEQRLVATIMVNRVSTLEKEDGIGMSQMVVSSGGS